jgi:SAM-dependent methyltransferase
MAMAGEQYALHYSYRFSHRSKEKMRREFLASLHCPYTGLPLLLSKELDGNGEEISYGIVSTEATDFPIVEGILRLHVDEFREPIVEHVRSGRRFEALTLALDRGPFVGRYSAAINFIRNLAFRSGFNAAGRRVSRLEGRRVRVLSDNNATFAEIVTTLSSQRNHDHQMYRFTMPGFLSTFPLVHLVRADGPVLSFACGTGHETFLISRMWPSATIVCADYSFSALQMAKKFFVPKGTYVCLDGDYRLPFESNYFSTIFSSDTLPILDSKLSLAQEFGRVGHERAVTILPHMHNRLVWPFAKSLTPSGYRQLFQNEEVRMLPDDNVIRDYFFDDVLDLTTDWSNNELATSGQHLSIIACKDSAGFCRSENLWAQRIRSMRHPCINPVYRIAGRSGEWNLRRQAGDYYVQAVTGEANVCLPDTCRIAVPSLDVAGLLELQRTDRAEFERLARSLVILDLPERFIKQPRGLERGGDLLTVRQRAAI